MKRLHAFSRLPGSGHPLNSALITERACKRDREEKRSLANWKEEGEWRQGNSSGAEKASSQEVIKHFFYNVTKHGVALLRLFITYLTNVHRICQQCVNIRCQHSSDEARKLKSVSQNTLDFL